MFALLFEVHRDLRHLSYKVDNLSSKVDKLDKKVDNNNEILHYLRTMTEGSLRGHARRLLNSSLKCG